VPTWVVVLSVGVEDGTEDSIRPRVAPRGGPHEGDDLRPRSELREEGRPGPKPPQQLLVFSALKFPFEPCAIPIPRDDIHDALPSRPGVWRLLLTN
jgi:hypothetical protein